ncbi:Uncharacterized protein DAT39_008988 [Clarias magur]|uniref:Uncharacterized protein n=1 Tax=Clarias magur TaxID=1594786 RepID=A0A8J4TT32_CLAMG|nr:Uncharacterized protein DAT39_008988 [Clarias magur]
MELHVSERNSEKSCQAPVRTELLARLERRVFRNTRGATTVCGFTLHVVNRAMRQGKCEKVSM